ncbi:DUF2521 family protein [Bacillus sp. AFS088145]|uniref:DUF2521 family protein n=1 Tax=Bacillus sp. AFS088145 TaxID=2033514 RepID=UPI000BF812CF|nr:DUF2521 family protein [Bacillus sp. AFS088145]PFH85269.1 KINB signaling pathway activation protein [Bacillus sp. AFS088145]
MNLITNFREKRRAKQIKFEKSLLKELKIMQLKAQLKDSFSYCIDADINQRKAREDYCFELAVETYLLGARYSRFGYYGEPIENVIRRSAKESEWLAYLFYSSVFGRKDDIQTEPFDRCKSFLNNWWLDGYVKGERRHRLRLSK